MSHRVPVPQQVTELRLLDRVDYQDAFAVATSSRRSPEQWMRTFLEDAPPWFRLPWVGVLRTAGARLVPRDDPGQVLGWAILPSQPDAIVLGLDAAVGLRVRLVGLSAPGQFVVATQVHWRTAAARALMAVVLPAHRFFVAYLLDRAAGATNPTRAVTAARS